MLDYLIINANVFDGTASNEKEVNVGINSDQITWIGSNTRIAKNIIDAKNCILCPGFIDTHTHSEFSLLADGSAQSKITQGVTTEINGNCGLSASPLLGEAYEHRLPELKILDIDKLKWKNFREFFELLIKRGIAVNFATLIGLGNIRASVIGYSSREPSASEMSKMKKLIKEESDLIKGMSTGLIYPPGVFTKTDEIIELMGYLASINPDAIYASHIRSEGKELIEAITEAIEIGHKSATSTHISHIKTAGIDNWHKIDKVISLIEDGRASGLNITCDRYPYTASCTDLDTILPPWTYDGGTNEELKRIQDPELKKRISSEIGERGDDYWKGVMVTSIVNPENAWMSGERLFDIAQRLKLSPMEALFKIIISEKAQTGAIFFSMNEDNLRRFLRLPYLMIGSDASARSLTKTNSMPHPRAFGTFPRYLSRYVRDEGILPLGTAISKITSIPAERFKLIKRGKIQEGYFADLTIFDYSKIKDTAEYKDPFHSSVGISYVFVNGVPAIWEGELTGRLSGRIV
ncbi:MAG: amidohydrolase family protein [Nitrospirae bacterium]|nr:amidohydrolase family protein [Nitrospirota bacterium]